MGLKKGRELFSQNSAINTSLKSLREKIIKEKGADSDYRPHIAVDGEVWARQSLSNPQKDSKVSGEYHSEPKVPVVSVSTSVVNKLKLLRSHGFEPILVLDGANHPLKDDEHSIRYEPKKGTKKKSLQENLEKLQDAYANPDKYTFDQVSDLRKATLRPREDITYEIVVQAKKSKFIVVCAPFESDHQFIALQNQNIIDCAWSIDTDILGLGIRHVINTLSKDGRIRVMSYDKLTTTTLPTLFGRPKTPVTQAELRLFCCMLGNDYLPKGKRNDGVVACTAKMKDYLSKQTPEERQHWITEYQLAHDTPVKFAKAMFAWEYAAAYLVVPNHPDVLPRDALKLGEYSIELGSMTAAASQRDEDFFVPTDANPKLGYIPHSILRENHPHVNQSLVPTHTNFFRFEKYVRTGQPLKGVEKQFNRGGHEVTPGAIISFDKQPMKFIPTRKLELWLSCRGLGTSEMDRSKMLVMVQRLLDHGIDALPLFVMRGGGAYIATSILEFVDEEMVDWKSGVEALHEIKGEKCACVDSIEFMTESFSPAHNSKRIRCLKPLKSGSFDLLDIKVSSNLRSMLSIDTEFFVIDFTCAPSQKGLGTEGKVYSMRLAFGKTGDDWTLMDTPYSLCGCPVGVFKICAHKGGALLLLYAIRTCFKDLCFSDLCKRLPPSIHSVARQLQLTNHLYPPPYSSEHQTEQAIKKEAKTSDDSQTPTNDDETNDIELEEQNDRELDIEQKSVPLIDVFNNVSQWCREIEISFATRGVAHSYDPEKSNAACTKAAKPETDTKYLVRKHIRFVNQEKSVSKGLAPKTLYGYYCKEYVSNMNVEDNAEHLTLLRAQTKRLYRSIYPEGAVYLDECYQDDSDESVIMINMDGDDSSGDSDYYTSDDSGE